MSRLNVQCSKCGKKYRTLNLHINQPIICNICRKLIKVDVECCKCGKKYQVNNAYLKHFKRINKPIMCALCCKTTPQAKSRMSEILKLKWQDDNYRQSQKNGIVQKYTDNSYHDKISKLLSIANRDDILKARRKSTFQETLATTDLRGEMSIRSKEMWSKDNFRQAVKNGMMKKEVREKMQKSRAAQMRTSKLEDILSKILSDLNVNYKRNYYIWPYLWDFCIDRVEQKPLLIEVQGDYWHNQIEHVVKNDKSKKTYYDRHLSDKYDLKYIWEHEFLCDRKIIDKLLYWIKPTSNEFNFDQVNIASLTDDNAEIFLRSYHYLGHKSGTQIGAFLNNNLIAVATFSNPVRYESATCENLKYNEVLELSRFCIATNYHKKNFASWFLSRCLILISKLKPDIKALIAFSDCTVNHSGTIYKATNWQQCGIVPPDYWYIDNSGHYMHKLTLYKHARRMSMKESEFVEKHGYNKVMGLEKVKYKLLLNQSKVESENRIVEYVKT